MEEVRDLQQQQRDLLQAWLSAADGADRFAILNELRKVERQLSGMTRALRIRPDRIRTYAI